MLKLSTIRLVTHWLLLPQFEKEIKAELEKTNDKAAAAYVGTVIAKRALEKGIKEVVFDRGGFIYQAKFRH